MKKIMIVTGICLLSMQTFACDICGCSGSGAQYFGILPWYQNHFAGIRYQYRTFTSHHIEPGDAHTTKEQFSTTEIWGRFSVKKNVLVYAFIPFNQYRQSGNDGNRNTSGIGDATIMAGINLVNTGESRNRIKHVLQVAAGVKLPTGKVNTGNDKEAMSMNMQAGSGSYDIPLTAMYTIRYNKTGFSTESNYRINTYNKDNFKFGNRFSHSIKAFRWADIGKENSLLPNIGLQYEQASNDHDLTEHNDYSGGHALYATAGCELFLKKISAGLQWQQPLQQHLAQGQVMSHARLSAQISYKF